MLTLTRRVQESIILRIPPSTEERIVEVKLAWTSGIRAGIGVESDLDIEVWRNEIWQEKQQAAGGRQ